MTTVKTLKAVDPITETKTMTYKDLLTISQGLAYINSKETKVWHAITKNLDSINDHVKSINEQHIALTEELAIKDDTGQVKKDTVNGQNQVDFGENIEEANTRWEKVLAGEVEIEFTPIQLEDLKDYGLDATLMKPLLGLVIIE